MRIEVKYGDGKEIVDLPDANIGEIVHPKELPPVDEGRLLEYAIANPVGSDNLDNFLKGAKNVLVIVNDATRPTPTGRILDAIDAHLEKCGCQLSHSDWHASGPNGGRVSVHLRGNV